MKGTKSDWVVDSPVTMFWQMKRTDNEKGDAGPTISVDFLACGARAVLLDNLFELEVSDDLHAIG
jgi:hypothetical protein